MKINWKVRIKNKAFWLTAIPALLLLIQQVAAIFGFSLDLGQLGNQICEVVETVFLVLTIVGVVNDPTVKGLRDSGLALTYDKPKEK